MRATQIMITAPLEARLVETDVPTDDLRPSEAVVRTRVSLLSGGTEGAFFRGLPLPGREPPPFPYPTGYANIGEVIAVGGPAAGVAVGDLVYTMSPHASIARVDAAARPCVAVPAGLPPEEAVFVRLMTVSLTTIRTARARAGDRAAVVGLGLVGNLGAQLLQNAGMTVTAADLIASRRALAGNGSCRSTATPRSPATCTSPARSSTAPGTRSSCCAGARCASGTSSPTASRPGTARSPTSAPSTARRSSSGSSSTGTPESLGSG